MAGSLADGARAGKRFALCENPAMRLPLPLALLGAMLVIAFGIELALAGRLILLPALPLAALLALAASRGRRGSP